MKVLTIRQPLFLFMGEQVFDPLKIFTENMVHGGERKNRPQEREGQVMWKNQSQASRKMASPAGFEPASPA